MEAFKYLKIGKAPGPTEVYAKMILASGDVGIIVLMELCHRILDEKGLPEDWAISVVIPMFKGKGDTINCGMHRGVKLIQHAMKIVEKILEKRLRTIAIDDMQFGFKPGKGTIDSFFALRWIQEEYLAKQNKLYMCLVDLEKAFDRVPRKVLEWAMRKKGIPEELATAVMSLYKGARTKVKVGTHFSGV